MAEASNKRLDGKIKFFTKKKENLFLRLQTTYDLIDSVNTDIKAKENFLIRCGSLESTRTEFNSIMDTINELYLEYEPMLSLDFQALNSFDEIYCKILNCKESLLRKQATPGDENNSGNNHSKSFHFRYPKLELPQFSGETKEWNLFYQTFLDSVVNNAELNDSDRIRCIAGKLSGKALDMISGIPAQPENFKLIWSTLVDRFQDQRALASLYLNNILEFKSLQKESAANLDRFLQEFASSATAFKSLKLSDTTDFILLHIALKKLHPDTIKHFELYYKSVVRSDTSIDITDSKSQIPTFSHLLSFIKDHAKLISRTDSYSATHTTTTNSKFNKSSYSGSKTTQAFLVNKPPSNQCVICSKDAHAVYFCPQFKRLSPKERYNLAKNKALCLSCLSTRHSTSSCKSEHSCSRCHSKFHHSLLHFNKSGTSDQANKVALPPSTQNINKVDNQSVTSGHSNTDSGTVAVSVTSSLLPTCSPSQVLNTYNTSSVLLSTAQVRVKDPKSNKWHLVRCLLDTASQPNLITTDSCNFLHLPKQKFISSVNGIGNISNPIRYKTSLTFMSKYNDTEYHIQAYVLDTATGKLPAVPNDFSSFPHLKGIPLADDHVPSKINLVLGASIFPYLLTPGIIAGPPNTPLALQSVLGYVVIGQCNINSNDTPHVLCTTVEEDESLTEIVSKFWELEDIPPSDPDGISSSDDCESIFKNTTYKTKDGRYSVALPFKYDTSLLGDSWSIARSRLLNLEKQLDKDLLKKKMYHEFLKDYEKQGHMTLSDSSSSDGCYLPHHCVMKPDSISTKLRVVWNASSTTSSGYSLNSILHTGPKLHNDLCSILLRLRLYKIAITADLKQMFRQIWVHPEHRKFQKILWRFDPDSEVCTYELNTVTFGVRPAPYLAIRTVQQVADDSSKQYPTAAAVAKRDFFVDDLGTSVATVQEAYELYRQLVEMFQNSGFELVKWGTNSSDFAALIPSEQQLNCHLNFNSDDSIKILGLQWFAKTDQFCFHVNLPDLGCTKRHMLSLLGRIFDPTGFLSPITVFAKMIIRDMWNLNLGWDDPPDESSNVAIRWNTFVKQLPLLEMLHFKRHLGTFPEQPADLVGFCDASALAYGAVVYVRTEDNSSAKCVLLTSKTRLTPKKGSITIPRLELCSAELLARLLRYVINSFSSKFTFRNIYAFSDSSVAIHWIMSTPAKWNVFVSRRITRIKEMLPDVTWRHVKGTENPADCLSRGLLPKAFINFELWFNGPPWLIKEFNDWPSQPDLPNKYDLDLETRNTVSVSCPTVEKQDEDVLRSLINNCSDYKKLLRIVAYILRIKNNSIIDKSTYTISAFELDYTEIVLIRFIQNKHFPQEIKDLNDNKLVSSHLKQLFPFLDGDLLRVGGRLSYSDLSQDQKHPLILPNRDHFVDLLIMYTHETNLHTGPTLVHNLLRQRFWILGGRSRIRDLLRKCNVCFRLRPKPTYPLMADLPAPRVKQCKAFLHTGVDYAGPINITISRRRGARSQKAYICLFVCLTTKALHIELASDLSTNTFLNCMKRFIARRGPVKIFYSDAGTNFIGARSYLNEIYNLLDSDDYKEKVPAYVASQRITWMFNPPASPHFGGIWESNVKAVKTHLFKVLGHQILSYEELNTLLVQIEGLLNSRPLCVKTSDTLEPEALTPSHFLCQTSLDSDQYPAPDLSDIPENRLTRFQLLDQLIQSYWKRWHLEYLHTLQVRQKWNTEAKPIKPGMIVVVMRDNAPPLSWPLGIIDSVHPGADGRVRVATVRIGDSIFKRPVVKLCPLPTQ